MLLAFDEGLRIEAQEFAQTTQELGGAVQSDGRLQIRTLQRLAEKASELPIHADVHIGIDQPRHILKMAAQGKRQIDFRADALDQATDLSQIARHVEGAVARSDDVDPRLLPLLAWSARGDFLLAVLRPQPRHGSIGALPLIFIDGARQESLDIRAFRRHAPADHLGDRTRHHHRRQVGVQGLVGALHGAFGTMLAKLFFGQPGHDDG